MINEMIEINKDTVNIEKAEIESLSVDIQQKIIQKCDNKTMLKTGGVNVLADFVSQTSKFHNHLNNFKDIID